MENTTLSSFDYEPTYDEIKEIEEYWIYVVERCHKYWYSEISPGEAIAIRDHVDDEIFEKYGIVGHSPIIDLRYDRYDLLTMEIVVPEYGELIKEQRDWGLYKGEHKDTTE